VGIAFDLTADLDRGPRRLARSEVEPMDLRGTIAVIGGERGVRPDEDDSLVDGQTLGIAGRIGDLHPYLGVANRALLRDGGTRYQTARGKHHCHRQDKTLPTLKGHVVGYITQRRTANLVPIQ
jgi:hypothetical protein